jgi:hypothetical protein
MRHRNVFPKHATHAVYWWIVKLVAGLWLLGHFFGHP